MAEKAQIDELTYGSVQEPEFDPAVAVVLQQLHRRMGRDQGLSRAEAIRAAIRWYIALAERLPFTEDHLLDEIEA